MGRRQFIRMCVVRKCTIYSYKIGYYLTKIYLATNCTNWREFLFASMHLVKFMRIMPKASLWEWLAFAFSEDHSNPRHLSEGLLRSVPLSVE